MTNEEINAVWAMLDRAGAEYVRRHGPRKVRQSEAIEEILAIVLGGEGGSAWTREQILEAWMHQAMTLIHGRVEGASAQAPTLASADLSRLCGHIKHAEAALTKEAAGAPVLLTAYVDGVVARVVAATGGRFCVEQVLRAWVLKKTIDELSASEEASDARGRFSDAN